MRERFNKHKVCFELLSEALDEIVPASMAELVRSRAAALAAERYAPRKGGRPIKYPIGTRFGKKVIVAEAGRNANGKRRVVVQCDCGRRFEQECHLVHKHYRCGACRENGPNATSPEVIVTLPGDGDR